MAPCPLVTACNNTEMQKVQKECEAMYTDEVRQKQCLNRCYAQNMCSGDSTIYRPIDDRNPFPNSEDSPVDKGNRQIGANWVGYTNYIKDDKDDPTSLTGPNEGRVPEYVIDLTPNDIRKIRDDTNRKYKNKGIDSYVELIYSTELDNTYEGKYRSSFIHDLDEENGGFAKYFTKTPESDR